MNGAFVGIDVAFAKRKRSTRRVSNHWRRKRIDVDVLDRYYSNGNIIIVSIPKLKYLL